MPADLEMNGGHVVTALTDDKATSDSNDTVFSVIFLQKMIAELLGTYFLIFTGCMAVAVNLNFDNVVTLPGIAIVFGVTVSVLIYSVGHISGAHFNPAVTFAFATCRRFPWTQVPFFVSCQILGATLGAATIRVIFTGHQDQFTGTLPSGSNTQAFIVEFLTTFFLMFVISGVATDSRAVGHFAGVAIGGTILLDVILSGPITGASMNPARTLGPAIASEKYSGVWVYTAATMLGAVSGAWIYNVIRQTDKSLNDIGASFTKCCP